MIYPPEPNRLLGFLIMNLYPAEDEYKQNTACSIEFPLLGLLPVRQLE
jgi:hypothetical protein